MAITKRRRSLRMEKNRRGKLYIISGPSGTGKSTIIEK
jgi:guanylate kinase